jgi:NTP pyrophosphatase (non-canonical NTP hydrolase)
MDALDEVKTELRSFVAERQWQTFHDPKNLAMLLASEVGELMSEYRWVTNENADSHSQQPAPRARIIEEIGDVGIALVMLCDRLNVDLVAAIRNKMARNAKNYPVEASRGRAERPGKD